MEDTALMADVEVDGVGSTRRGDARRRRRPGRTLVVAWLAVAALLVGACASDEEGSSSDDTTVAEATLVEGGWANATDLEPTTGGTLNVTLTTPPASLDPRMASYGMTTEGPALTAIYDNLLRYDPETGEFEGQLAESIEHNADFSQWTLKLKPGLTFSDGTPLDSAAVVASIQRLPGGRSPAASYASYFASFETPDPVTVVMNMVEPLNNVDGLLAAEMGLITSPAAVAAAGDAFGTQPVGAGPFMVQTFNPDSELVLVKNPAYGGGEVRLDTVRFTWSAEQAGNIDRIETGQSDMTFLTTVDQRTRAIESGMAVWTAPAAGSGMAINSAPGRAFPGNDPRVREAIAMAINLDSVNERVNDGDGQMGNFLFPPGSRLHTESNWGTYDPEGARALLDEVKADTGWDGSFVLSTPIPSDLALSFQAQLNAAGFNAQVDQLQTFTQLIERNIINKDFDVSIWVLSNYETNVWQVLSRSLGTGPGLKWMGYSNPELDALLNELRAAPDDATTVDVLDRIAQLWQTEQPFYLTGTQPYALVTSTQVGGVETTAMGLFLWADIFKA